MNLKQNQNRNANRDYYQRMYDQIHATDELKERLISMNTYNKNDTNKNSRNNTRRNVWKAAAAVAALSIVIPTGAYAANHYFGISEFFTQSGHTLPDDAGRLIETDIEQTKQSALTNNNQTNKDAENNTKRSSTEKNDSSKNADSQKSDTKTDSCPVSFTIQEVLCDSGTVNIVIEAKAVQSGRYLLVPDDMTLETDSAETIGIHQDISIGDYARSKGLEILYVGSGFHPDSPFCPASCSLTSKSVQDDTLLTFLSADRAESDTDLHAVMTHTIRPASASNNDTDILRTSTSFTLNDKSTSKIQTYQPKHAEVPNTQASVTKVTMEQTELSTYVTVYYTNPQNTEDDGLYFKILDNTGREWPSRGGRGIEQLADGSFCLRLVYDQTGLPETCILKAFDCLEKNVYGQMKLHQTK